LFENTTSKVLASALHGAGFTEYKLDIQPKGGALDPLPDEYEYFVYVISGEIQVKLDNKSDHLILGGYAYTPPKTPITFQAEGNTNAEVLLLRKPYIPWKNMKPKPIFGNEKEVEGEVDPAFGSDFVWKKLLPADNAYDLAMNVAVFQPNAAFPMVEVHPQEHGIYILSGKGKYLLHDKWYSVEKDDFIWLGPYTPQSAISGEDPLKYVYSKDWNRDVLPAKF
jgi:(S)-ureidoglycine aminohydrolase